MCPGVGIEVKFILNSLWRILKIYLRIYEKGDLIIQNEIGIKINTITLDNQLLNNLNLDIGSNVEKMFDIILWSRFSQKKSWKVIKNKYIIWLKILVQFVEFPFNINYI